MTPLQKSIMLLGDAAAVAHWPSPRSKELRRMRGLAAIVGIECEAEFGRDGRGRIAKWTLLDRVRYRLGFAEWLVRRLAWAIGRRLVLWHSGRMDSRKLAGFAREDRNDGERGE